MPRAQRPPAAVLAAVALSVAAIAAVGGAAASTGAQDNGRILFASDVAYFRAHDSLHTIGADGREGRLLVSNVDDTRSVQWSPDGTRIAFFRNGAIVVVPARGGKPRVAGRVTDGADTQFSWSPDGTRIAFFDFDANDTLVVVRVGARMLVKRFATHGGGGDKPAWSPDGKRIAFIRDRGNTGDLSAIDLANGHVSVLFRGLVGAGLAWSPDGRTIAYDNGTTIFLADLARHTHRALGPGNTASWSPDGTKIAVIPGLDNVDVIDVHTGRSVHISGSFETNLRQTEDAPTWTPDGRRLAYARDGDIYTVDADGGPEQLLVGGPTLDSDPAWSRDGTRIAFARRAATGAPTDVWTAAADGSGAVQLTRIGDAHDSCNAVEGFSPAWSPDGTEIAYVRGIGVNSTCFDHFFLMTIHAIHPDGGGDRLVTTGGAGGQGGASDPAWSPDGARLTFTISAQYDSHEDFTYRIGVVDRSGRGLRVLFGRGHSQDPDWR